MESESLCLLWLIVARVHTAKGISNVSEGDLNMSTWTFPQLFTLICYYFMNSFLHSIEVLHSPIRLSLQVFLKAYASNIILCCTKLHSTFF